MEKGIGKEHYTYEIERNTKRLKFKKDGYTKILNRAYIEVSSANRKKRKSLLIGGIELPILLLVLNNDNYRFLIYYIV